jgi:phenylpropionate dioxygenase-like ring-hydroxylating dioxygenase large terminal subunit
MSLSAAMRAGVRRHSPRRGTDTSRYARPALIPTTGRYSEDGRLSEIPHELFGRSLPAVGIATYPVEARYGLIWLFPGDPTLAPRRAIPELSELDGPDPWAYVPIDFTWQAHHSMVMDNLCDLSHAHLHRRFPVVHAGTAPLL